MKWIRTIVLSGVVPFRNGYKFPKSCPKWPLAMLDANFCSPVESVTKRSRPGPILFQINLWLVTDQSEYNSMESIFLRELEKSMYLMIWVWDFKAFKHVWIWILSLCVLLQNQKKMPRRVAFTKCNDINSPRVVTGSKSFSWYTKSQEWCSEWRTKAASSEMNL